MDKVKELDLEDLAGVAGGVTMEGETPVLQYWMMEAYINYTKNFGTAETKQRLKNITDKAGVIALASELTGFSNIEVRDEDVQKALELLSTITV